MEQGQKILINQDWKFMHGDFQEAKELSIFLVILIMVVVFGGMIAAMIAIIRKFDPARNDSVNKANSTKAQELLPFEDITNNMIVLGNHRYRAVISCSSTNYQLKTNGEREQIE